MSERGLAAIAAAANSSTSAAAITAGTAAPAKGAVTTEAAPSATASVDTAAIVEAAANGVKEGIKAERARIKAIVTSEKAKGREQLAQSLAFNTDLTSEQAIAVLGDTPEAARASRLDGIVPAPRVDAQESGTASPSAGLAAAVQKLVAKRYGESAAR
jgi:hypothetical protein